MHETRTEKPLSGFGFFFSLPGTNNQLHTPEGLQRIKDWRLSVETPVYLFSALWSPFGENTFSTEALKGKNSPRIRVLSGVQSGKTKTKAQRWARLTWCCKPWLKLSQAFKISTHPQGFLKQFRHVISLMWCMKVKVGASYTADITEIFFWI